MTKKIRERLADQVLLDRAMKKVDHSDSQKCWEWSGALGRGGYGTLWDGTRTAQAHRLVFEATHGMLLGRWQLVCHSCDNPRCVNPEHLWLGTPKENTQDMIKKGRRVQSPLCGNALKNGGAAGSKNNMAKLDDDKVQEIRTSSESAINLAKKFGVKPGAIYKIRSGQRWNHNHQDAR